MCKASIVQHLSISQRPRKMAFHKPQTGILDICSGRITLQNRFLMHIHYTYESIISITYYQLDARKNKGDPSCALFNCLNTLFISCTFSYIQLWKRPNCVWLNALSALYIITLSSNKNMNHFISNEVKGTQKGKRS